MTLAGAVETTEASAPPRARGAVRLSVKPLGRQTALDGLRVSGSLKLVFPRPVGDGLDAVLVNTAGGVTGGDRFTAELRAETGTALTLTTQAAERAYRALGDDPGRIATKIAIEPDARLAWLPQETILFDGANLARSLVADLAGTARFLLVEPVLFGRRLMGEELRRARFTDRVEIRRDGRTLWLDATRLAGDIAATLDRPAIAAGGRAAALVVYAAPDAEPMRDRLRALLPATAGASLAAPDLLVARFVAADGYALRETLVPAIKLLNRNEIPRPWML
ncbi:MAG: urease accessory protein UreD [Maritimibacter sp.]|nr:urease accessory protein UreD [Maritimibacter sp.]